MTSDPKAPGAAAVYLDIEEEANDPVHYESVYMRIKVLTEKGKELATVDIPYLKGNKKVSDIKGRTIHADGTIIPLTVKPEDLLDAKSGDRQFGHVAFTLPSVEVGSILEYRYQLGYDDNQFSSPEWEIQRPYFVHKAHYQFAPFKAFAPQGTPNTGTSMYLVDERGRAVNSLIWWGHLPDGVKIETSAGGFYSVDVTDVPAIPDEEFMPPIESTLYKVLFYYKYASNAADFWANEGKFWSKDVDKFAEQSKTLKAAAQQLISPQDTDTQKATKLYAAMQALDNTDYSREKSASELKQLKLKEARHAEDTWTQKSGTSEDIAMLYLAMLRAVGLEAYAVKIVDRNRAVFDPSYMYLGQLDTTLVAVKIDGKEVVLDPGEKMCPFQTVNWRHSGAMGLGQSDKGLQFITTPSQAYAANTTNRVGDITLDAHGGVSGSVTIAMNGQVALHWRQAALRNDEDEVKKQFDRSLESLVPDGVQAHIDHFESLTSPYTDLIAVVNLKGSMGTATAKRVLLPGFFFDTRSHVPFVNEEKRLVPVDMHYADRITNTITYHLPDGMAVEGMPQPLKVSWPGHAVLATASKADPGKVVIADSMVIGFTQAKPEEYQDLRTFFQKVAATNQQQLVLTTASAASPAKGN